MGCVLGAALWANLGLVAGLSGWSGVWGRGGKIGQGWGFK